MTKENINQENSRLYEIGFHLVSTVAPDKVADEFEIIKNLITKNNGEIVKEGEPKLMNLAYMMVKKIGGANHRFTQAHFAWIKFNMSPEDVVVFKQTVDTLVNVLRYIVVKTTDDFEHSTAKLVEELEQEVELENSSEATENVEATEETEEVKGSEKALDEAIDEMVK